MNYLRKIAYDSTNYGPIHAAQTRYLLKRNLYRALRDIPALLPLDARFQQQFDSLALTNIAKFMQVEDLITDSLWTQARTVNATIIPQGAIEDQARTVNQIWIERLIARATGMYVTGQPFNPDGPAFNPLQYAQISAIAYKCPFTDGPAVYLARAMKNVADKRNNYFIDDCPVYDPGYRLEQPKNAAALAPAFKLYPNPARENITLEAFLPENEQAKLEVIAVDGRTVAHYDVQNGTEQIDARQWSAGVYLFRITLSRAGETPAFMHKIIILK